MDASIYEVLPFGVSIPKSIEEVQALIAFAAKENISIVPRGAATGITGGCLGEGLIIDTSKYLNQILEIDARSALCQPGVIQDDLNKALSASQRRLGPDTSTGDRATLGGMAANNAAGARSLYYGSMIDAILEVELILSNGEIVHFKELNEQEWQAKLALSSQEGIIYQAAEEIRQHSRQSIERAFPPLPRRSFGYHLDQLLKPFPLNLAKLIAGSEGTLGIISALRVKTAKKADYLELHLHYYDSMNAAMQAVPDLLKTNPMSLELIDDKILTAGHSSPSLKSKIGWLKQIPKALLVAEYTAPFTSNAQIITDPVLMQHIWDVRKGGLGLLLSKRSYTRAIAFIEDISVPPLALPHFMQTFLNYLQEQGKDAGIYGHAGPGCLHIRPYMDLRNPSEVVLMQKIMQDVATMVKAVGGTMSGEHGQGLIRSWLNESFYGEEILNDFKKLKSAFDPLGIMNPHKIVDPLPVDRNLRKPPLQDPKTFLHFEGGLALAADLCNGNGACRKKTGVMCPSFQVTHDEYDSTRARANAFRSLLQNKEKADLAAKSLHEILDLCIQCKGCKTECPSEVDMAKMKSEALYHYQEKNGYSLRSTLFSQVDKLNKLTFPFRKMINPLQKSTFAKKIFNWLGISHEPPSFAASRFSILAQDLPQIDGKPVVLLSDTYTEFYNPEIGIAAIQVLNQLGYKVIVPPYACCGRPAISKGFLESAKTKESKLYNQLRPYHDIPIITLEPSCQSALLDDWHSPIECLSFDTFIAKHLPLPFSTPPVEIALHGHCHQKALQGMKATTQVLLSLQADVIEIPSGCCGMAGSFGYESEHTSFSEQIGELKLLPFIRNLPLSTPIISNGHSCRTQIALYTDRKALHLAEWLVTLI